MFNILFFILILVNYLIFTQVNSIGCRQNVVNWCFQRDFISKFLFRSNDLIRIKEQQDSSSAESSSSEYLLDVSRYPLRFQLRGFATSNQKRSVTSSDVTIDPGIGCCVCAFVVVTNLFAVVCCCTNC